MISTKPPRRSRRQAKSAETYGLEPPEVEPTWQAQIPTATGIGSYSETDFQFDRPPRSRSPLLSSALIFLTGVVMFWYSAHHDVLIGQIAAPIVTLAALHGLWRGGFRKLIMLAVTIGVLYVAITYPDLADPVIRRVAGAPSSLANGIVTGSMVILALVITSIVVKRFRRRHIANRPFVLGVDRLIGAGIGLAEGVFVVLCICWVVVMIQPHAKLVRDHQDTKLGSVRHRVATTLVRVAGEAQTEPLGRIVEATNLIEVMPVVADMINDLNTTGQFNLEGLDPATMEKLNEFLQQSPAGDLGGLEDLIEKHKQNSEARDKAYRELRHLRNNK